MNLTELLSSKSTATSKTSGGVAVISQSADYLAAIATSDPPFPITFAINLEEWPELTVADVVEAIIEDEDVTAMNLYLKAVENAPKLSEFALKAARKGVPIVVVKGWRSTAVRSAMTALFERLGFIRCKTPAEARETLKMLIYGGRPLGNKLAIATDSPTNGIIGADVAEAAGLEIPLLDDYDVENPHIISPDGGAHLGGQPARFKTLFEDEINVAVLMLSHDGSGRPAEDWLATAQQFAKEAADLSLPCAYINTADTSLPTSMQDALIDLQIAPLHGLQSGFKAIANTIRFVDQMIFMAQMPTNAIVLTDAPMLDNRIQLDEIDGKRNLQKARVTIPKGVFLQGAKNLDLSELRFPVVVKAVSADLTHKTELGAVRLHIENEHQIRQTVFEMNGLLDSVAVRGYLIEEMVIDGIGELLIGIRHINGIGQALTLAFGGVSVELLQDVKTLVLPASSYEIERALRSLRLFPTINGWRGREAADIGVVVETISLICAYAQSEQNRLVALEINPLIVRPGGRHPVAADVVMQFGETAGER